MEVLKSVSIMWNNKKLYEKGKKNFGEDYWGALRWTLRGTTHCPP
jgi:hypothetical protein